jgi:hypothetical protein
MQSRKLAAALALVTTLGSASVMGCGKSTPPPPVDDTRVGQGQTNSGPYDSRGRGDDPSVKPGMTTGKKVVLLAGAAALYYMYKHHQASAQTGPESQYYLSKNGRVYYRDADHRAHWVTPPTEGLQVPESEAAEYRHFQGYDGNANGRDLAGISNDD